MCPYTYAMLDIVNILFYRTINCCTNCCCSCYHPRYKYYSPLLMYSLSPSVLYQIGLSDENKLVKSSGIVTMYISN